MQTITIANEIAQSALSVFTVKGTQLATGDEIILDKPTYPGSPVNVGAVYLHPSHTTYRTRHDARQDRWYREAVHHHLIRYTSGPAEGLVDTVPESLLIEYVTADGLVGEL